MNLKKSSPKQDFVRIGWFAIHKAVLINGALLDTASLPNWKEFGHTNWIDTEIYCALLKPVIEITELNIEVPLADGDLIGNEVWQKLRKLKQEYSDKPCNAFVRTSIQGLCSEFADWKDKPLAIRNSTINLYDPLKAADLGWSLIELGSKVKKYFPDSLFWGLALLGWVYTLYCHIEVCPLCFRWTVPGSKYCFMHSQSNSIGSHIGAGKAFIQYRKGFTTLKLANKQRLIIKKPCSIVDASYSDAILAEYLFFNNPSEMEISDIAYALTTCPRVLEKLGGNNILSMSSLQLLEFIRTEINPIEFFPTELALNILYYEKILELESVKPGRPKGELTYKTQTNIKEYSEMSKKGMRKASIAEALGISKSTLSNWISRYPSIEIEK